MKLSPSALSLYLRSPKAFYWRYIAQLEPILLSAANYDHDKLFGVCWSEFVDRFYRGMGETENRELTLASWYEKTAGWCPQRDQNRLTQAMNALMPQYYTTFSPDDGIRIESEKWLENDLFIGRLDGLGDKLVHEVKSTSRAPMISEQLWKVKNSLQVKLYCVLAEAEHVCIEFAFKDPPYVVYRGPVEHIDSRDRIRWASELQSLASRINDLGDREDQYICHPDTCCLLTKRVVSMCPYRLLCVQGLNETTAPFYKKRVSHREPQEPKDTIHREFTTGQGI